VEPERVTEFTWRIAPVERMRVPGLVFASEALFRGAVDDRAIEQVTNVATLPGIVGASYAMPDVHRGYGFPIGGVAATDPEVGGVISPGGVGFDIACGVRLLRSTLTWDEVRPRIRELVHSLGSATPRGVGAGARLRLDRSEVQKVLVEGVRFPMARGIGSPEDQAFCEGEGVEGGARPEEVSERAVERGARQLGSLGAGNHFLEVQVVDEVEDPATADVFGLVVGLVCVMIHCGSRGLGHQVCTDHVAVMDRLMRPLGIDVPDRQLACVPVTHEAGRGYLGAMAAAANFARANRHVLADGARESFSEVFGRSARLDLVYDVAHNLASMEEHMVGGRARTLCVHRKGATRALGPGSPELPPAYRGVGQPVLVPGSMGTASFVLSGTGEGEATAFASAWGSPAAR